MLYQQQPWAELYFHSSRQKSIKIIRQKDLFSSNVSFFSIVKTNYFDIVWKEAIARTLIISLSFQIVSYLEKCPLKRWNVETRIRHDVWFPSWKYRNVTDRSSSPGNYPTLKKKISWKDGRNFKKSGERKALIIMARISEKKSCTRWPLTAWAWLVNFRLYWYETAIFYFPWDERFIPLRCTLIYNKVILFSCQAQRKPRHIIINPTGDIPRRFFFL
jgi:hypothetical protein